MFALVTTLVYVKPMTLLPIDQALIKVTESLKILSSDKVSVAKALNRVLTEDIFAKLTQPPFSSSAMDGYAVRAEDLNSIPVTLDVTGESAAGHSFSKPVQKCQAVRIFTGAPVPEGADTVIMQENTTREGDKVTITVGNDIGANIRPKGTDFNQGDVLLKSGTILTAKDLALAAAMNWGVLNVRRKPVIAVLATGDELVEPGETPNPDQIISSIPSGLVSMIENWGAEALYLGIAKDNETSLREKISKGLAADILITIGGASVGDHDLVQKVLRDLGMDLNFWKVAIRPGKPIMHGQLGDTHVLGLPGNPVSAFICAEIFLREMIGKLLGTDCNNHNIVQAFLAEELSSNGPRQHYMRASTKQRDDGLLDVIPAASQDSSLLKTYASSDCLIVRSPHAPPAKRGEVVDIILI